MHERSHSSSGTFRMQSRVVQPYLIELKKSFLKRFRRKFFATKHNAYVVSFVAETSGIEWNGRVAQSKAEEGFRFEERRFIKVGEQIDDGPTSRQVLC